jgi:hypothetical protein
MSVCGDVQGGDSRWRDSIRQISATRIYLPLTSTSRSPFPSRSLSPVLLQSPLCLPLLCENTWQQLQKTKAKSRQCLTLKQTTGDLLLKKRGAMGAPGEAEKQRLANRCSCRNSMTDSKCVSCKPHQNQVMPSVTKFYHTFDDIAIDCNQA